MSAAGVLSTDCSPHLQTHLFPLAANLFYCYTVDALLWYILCGWFFFFLVFMAVFICWYVWSVSCVLCAFCLCLHDSPFSPLKVRNCAFKNLYYTYIQCILIWIRWLQITVTEARCRKAGVFTISGPFDFVVKHSAFHDLHAFIAFQSHRYVDVRTIRALGTCKHLHQYCFFFLSLDVSCVCSAPKCIEWKQLTTVTS